ncbi:MAG: acyloxyacyl hydrolase [Candidatus Omnitrophica bacterium]|nr:acyloxyacyl hydrolase [Candidatus Omnitrophota bacterium]
MKNTKFFVLLVLSFIFVFVLANAFAADETLASASDSNGEVQLAAVQEQAVSEARPETKETSDHPRWLKEIGILSGYASGPLDEKPDYEFVPMIFRFGLDLNPFINKFSWDTKGLLELQLEPFINTVVSPNNNVEIGSNFVLKYAFPLTKKFYPYVEGGLGMLYMSQHTREQSTQYNFLPQGGAGLMYFLKDNLALTVGYRYRHLSNNSFKSPNSGINVDMYLAGLSIVY